MPSQNRPPTGVVPRYGRVPARTTRSSREERSQGGSKPRKSLATSGQPVRRPIHWKLEESRYLSELSKVTAPYGKWVILELRLPLWAVGEVIRFQDDGSANYYHIPGGGTKAFLLDPSEGLCDSWANVLGIRLGTVRVPNACKGVIGQMFIDSFSNLAATTLRDTPLKVGLKGVHIYLDSYKTSLAIGPSENRSPPCPNYPSDGPTCQEASNLPPRRRLGEHLSQDLGRRVSKLMSTRTPVYSAQWYPTSQEDHRTWNEIKLYVEKFGDLLQNAFRAAGLPRDCLQFRNFGKRGIVIRRFSEPVSEEVERRCVEFQQSQTVMEGMVGCCLEIIDRNSKDEAPRFCGERLAGRVPLISMEGDPSIVYWGTDPSNYVSVHI